MKVKEEYVEAAIRIEVKREYAQHIMNALVRIVQDEFGPNLKAVTAIRADVIRITEAEG